MSRTICCAKPGGMVEKAKALNAKGAKGKRKGRRERCRSLRDDKQKEGKGDVWE
jgi:hypothetical protein